jgi:hypothetical protein
MIRKALEGLMASERLRVNPTGFHKVQTDFHLHKAEQSA